MQTLLDLRDTEFTSFMGTAVYRKRFDADELRGTVLNLGEVAGVSDVRLNGKELGYNGTDDACTTSPEHCSRVRTNSKCA